MTDARFPERWLNDRRVLRLSATAFRLFVTSLAWSVSNRTDGILADDDLTLIPHATATDASELHRAGLWSRDADRWVVAEFASTQTTAAQLAGLEHKRVMDRERQARHRSKARSGTESSVTRDNDRDAMRDTEDRTGKDRLGGVEVTNGEISAEQDGFPDETWPRLASGYDH